MSKPVTIDPTVVVKSTGAERERWLASIKLEVDSLLQTGTLRLATEEEVSAEKTTGSALAPSKMVFVIKPGKDSGTVKHKSRLVV